MTYERNGNKNLRNPLVKCRWRCYNLSRLLKENPKRGKEQGYVKKYGAGKRAYQFEAKMPLKHAIPLGLQHVFAMFVGNLTPLLIHTSACGIAGW